MVACRACLAVPDPVGSAEEDLFHGLLIPGTVIPNFPPVRDELILLASEADGLDG